MLGRIAKLCQGVVGSHAYKKNLHGFFLGRPIRPACQPRKGAARMKRVGLQPKVSKIAKEQLGCGKDLAIPEYALPAYERRSSLQGYRRNTLSEIYFR